MSIFSVRFLNAFHSHCQWTASNGNEQTAQQTASQTDRREMVGRSWSHLNASFSCFRWLGAFTAGRRISIGLAGDHHDHTTFSDCVRRCCCIRTHRCELWVNYLFCPKLLNNLCKSYDVVRHCLLHVRRSFLLDHCRTVQRVNLQTKCDTRRRDRQRERERRRA